MNKAADSTTKSSREPGPAVLGVILLDIANTGWRIAVPVTFLSGIGIWADKHSGHVVPGFALLGMVLGFFVSYLLVKRQIKSINEREHLA